MKTTDLFAEIIVIGIGTLAAVVLLVLAYLPGMAAHVPFGAPMTLVPALAAAYVLGIITDRAADWALGKISERRREIAGEESRVQWKLERDRLFAEHPSIMEDGAYARARLRVVRGWALNSVLLAAASAIYFYRQPAGQDGMPSATMACVGFGVLAALCLWVWNSFDRLEARAIKDWKAIQDPEGSRTSQRS